MTAACIGLLVAALGFGAWVALSGIQL